MIKDYFVLSIRNLKHRGVRSWLTLLGIVIGVLVVVSLILLGNGLKLAITNQFGIASSEIISVQAGGISRGPPGSGSVNSLTKKDLEEIQRISSVKKAIGRNIGYIQIEFQKVKDIGYLTNIQLDERRFLYQLLNLEMEEGRFFENGDVKKVVLGNNFFTGKSSLKGKEISSGDRININGERFEVIGITKKQGSFITDNVIYMTSEDMKNLLDYGDNFDIIAVQPESKDKLDQTIKEIEKNLRKFRNVKEGEEDFQVSTPEATLEMIEDIITGVQVFIIIIASISIIVGIVGIVNTMTTSVLDRKKDIGIMKAIGAKNSQIFLQFFIESGMLGLIGGVIGIISGILLGWIGISFLGKIISTDLSLEIDWILLIGVFIGSFIIGGIAGISPAMKAANQDPVEALR